jgi:hypothetical protein
VLLSVGEGGPRLGCVVVEAGGDGDGVDRLIGGADDGPLRE